MLLGGALHTAENCAVRIVILVNWIRSGVVVKFFEIKIAKDEQHEAACLHDTIIIIIIMRLLAIPSAFTHRYH